MGNKKTSRNKQVFRYPPKLDRTKLPEVDNKIILRIRKGYYVLFNGQYFKVVETKRCLQRCCKYKTLLVLQSLTCKTEYYMNVCPSVFAILKIYKTKWQMSVDKL